MTGWDRRRFVDAQSPATLITLRRTPMTVEERLLYLSQPLSSSSVSPYRHLSHDDGQLCCFNHSHIKEEIGKHTKSKDLVWILDTTSGFFYMSNSYNLLMTTTKPIRSLRTFEVVYEHLLVNSWKWLHLNWKLQRKKINGLLLPWILFPLVTFSYTTLHLEMKRTKDMQVVAMTRIEKRGLCVTRCNIKSRGEELCFSYLIADTHAYYICSCKHAHLHYAHPILYHPECFIDRLSYNTCFFVER